MIYVENEACFSTSDLCKHTKAQILARLYVKQDESGTWFESSGKNIS